MAGVARTASRLTETWPSWTEMADPKTEKRKTMGKGLEVGCEPGIAEGVGTSQEWCKVSTMCQLSNRKSRVGFREHVPFPSRLLRVSAVQASHR